MSTATPAPRDEAGAGPPLGTCLPGLREAVALAAAAAAGARSSG